MFPNLLSSKRKMRIENVINIMIAPAFHVCIFVKTITLKPTNQNGYCFTGKNPETNGQLWSFSIIFLFSSNKLILKALDIPLCLKAKFLWLKLIFRKTYLGNNMLNYLDVDRVTFSRRGLVCRCIVDFVLRMISFLICSKVLSRSCFPLKRDLISSFVSKKLSRSFTKTALVART